MSDDFHLNISDFDIDFSTPSGLGSTSDPVQEILTLLEEDKTAEALEKVDAYRSVVGATPLMRHLLALTIFRLGRLLPALKVMRAAHEDLPDAYEHAEILSVL